MGPSYYTTEARKSRDWRRLFRGSQQVTRQTCFIAIGILLHDSVKRRSCGLGLFLRDERESKFVERGRRRLRPRVLRDDQLVNRICCRTVLVPGEGLPNVQLRQRGVFESRVFVEQILEARSGDAEATTLHLVEGDLKKLRWTRSRRGLCRVSHSARRRHRHRLHARLHRGSQFLQTALT